MAHVFADRVADTSSTTGQSSFALDNEEPTGYQNFDDVCGNSDTIYYAAAHALLDEWEVGLGTYGAGTNVLARTTVLASSNAGSKVTFSSGTKHIIATLPASVMSSVFDATLTAIAGLTLAQGDLIYGTGVDTVAALAKDTNATRYLSNTGSSNNPAWAQVALGTGISGFGTGIATALAINTGSAGAPVLFNGALGTPNSGTLTNCTGLPSIVVANEATDTTCFLLFATAGTGELAPKTNANLAFNSNTGVLSLTNAALTTPVLGTPSSGTLTNCTGLPSIVVANEAADTTCFLAFFTAATGELAPKTNAALAFNSSTGVLSLTSPALTTPVLGTPSSGTLTNCTGLPSIVAANEGTDTTCFPVFFTAATGELGPKTNANLTYNSNTGAFGVTTIELGHATQNTLSASGGVLSIEGVVVKSVGIETIFIPAAAMISRTTNGAASGTAEMTTNKNMFRTLDFDTTTQEFAQFHVRMPKSWNESTVTAVFTWSHAATVTNFGVVFALEAVAISNDDAGDVAWGTAQQIADTGGTTNDIYVTGATPAITIAGTPQAEDYVMFQVKRVPADGSDNLAVDARLHGVTLYITTDATNDA